MSSAATPNRKRPSPSPSPAPTKRAKSASPPPRHQEETKEESVRLWDLKVKVSKEFARQGLTEPTIKIRGTQSNVVAWARICYANQSITIDATTYDPIVLIDDVTLQKARDHDAELRRKQELTKDLWPEDQFGPAVVGVGTPATIDLYVDSKHYKL